MSGEIESPHLPLCEAEREEYARLVTEEQKLADYFFREYVTAGQWGDDIGATPADTAISELKRLRKELTDAESRMTAKFAMMVREECRGILNTLPLGPLTQQDREKSEGLRLMRDKLIAKLYPHTLLDFQQAYKKAEATHKLRRAGDHNVTMVLDMDGCVLVQGPTAEAIRKAVDATDWEVDDAH